MQHVSVKLSAVTSSAVIAGLITARLVARSVPSIRWVGGEADRQLPGSQCDGFTLQTAALHGMM